MRNVVITNLNKFSNNKLQISDIDKELIDMCKLTSQFLRENNNLLLTRVDKGNTTVAIDKKSYIRKITELLEDKKTYTILTKDPVKKLERTINTF